MNKTMPDSNLEHNSVSRLTEIHNKVSYAVIPSYNSLNDAVINNPYVNCIFVRVGDFVNSDGTKKNKHYSEIEKAGSISEYFNSGDKTVILSSITKDRICESYAIERELYSDMINTMCPDFYMTPDMPSFSFDERLSDKNDNMIIENTAYLLDNCQDSIPLGVIKGANPKQKINMADKFKQMEITELVLDLGAYTNVHTPHNLWREANDTVNMLHNRGFSVFAYGLGSTSSINRFSHCDGLLTQAHFIEPKYGHHTDEFGNSYTRRVDCDVLKGTQDDLNTFDLLSREYETPANLMSGLMKDDISNVIKRISKAFDNRCSYAAAQTDLDFWDSTTTLSLESDYLQTAGYTQWELI